MTTLLPACLWLALQPVVVIESEATCPTATDVAQRVTALLPVHEKKDAPDLARISDRGDAWIVTLALPDGTPIAERVLDRAFPCADLASAAAVIIATWESDVHPEFRPAPLPAPPPRPATPVAVATPAGDADAGAVRARRGRRVDRVAGAVVERRGPCPRRARRGELAAVVPRRGRAPRARRGAPSASSRSGRVASSGGGSPPRSAPR